MTFRTGVNAVLADIQVKRDQTTTRPTPVIKQYNITVSIEIKPTYTKQCLEYSDTADSNINCNQCNIAASNRGTVTETN